MKKFTTLLLVQLGLIAFIYRCITLETYSNNIQQRETKHSHILNQCFVVNRFSRVDRLIESRSMLDSLGIKCKIWNAYEKESGFIQSIHKMLMNKLPADFSGTRLSNAEVSVFASHVGILRHVFFNKIPSVLILEDDADTSVESFQVGSKMLSDFNQTWDMIFLGHCFESDFIDSVPVLVDNNSEHKLYASRKPLCAHAYVVSLQGAKKLLEILPPITEIWETIDMMYSIHIQRKDISAFTLQPMIFSQNDFQKSDLRQEGMSFKAINGSLREQTKKNYE